ncbi:MAG: cupin domain-containing protein [Verrucomicrobiota bacterium]
MKERPLIQASQNQVLSLPAETRFDANGIVSRTVLNTLNSRVILFGFAEGQELSEHTSTQHALIQILSGECEFSVEGTWRTLRTGDLLHMPPHTRHAVQAKQEFSMLLTLVKPSPDLSPAPALNLAPPRAAQAAAD